MQPLWLDHQNFSEPLHEKSGLVWFGFGLPLPYSQPGLTGLFPACRKILEHKTQSNVFLSDGNNPRVLKNSTEHAEAFFIAFRQFPQMTSISLRIS